MTLLHDFNNLMSKLKEMIHVSIQAFCHENWIYLEFYIFFYICVWHFRFCKTVFKTQHLRCLASGWKYNDASV